MSCGQPCWFCGDPIPAERHKLNIILRMFCSDNCRESFRNYPWKEEQHDNQGTHQGEAGET